MTFTRGLAGLLLAALVLFMYHSVSATTPTGNAYPSNATGNALVSPSTLVKNKTAEKKTQPDKAEEKPGVLERAYRSFMNWSAGLAGAPNEAVPFERKNTAPVNKTTAIERGAHKALDAASGLAGNDRSGNKPQKDVARRTIKMRMDETNNESPALDAEKPVVAPATPPGDLRRRETGAPPNSASSFSIDPLTRRAPLKPMEPIYSDTPDETVKPLDPIDSTAPAEPVKPLEPISSNTPTKTLKPLEPIVSNAPTGTVKPLEPITSNTPTKTAKMLEPIVSPQHGDLPMKDGDVISIPPAKHPVAAIVAPPDVAKVQPASLIVPPGEINPHVRSTAARDSHAPAHQDTTKPYDGDDAINTPLIGSPPRLKDLPPLVGRY